MKRLYALIVAAALCLPSVGALAWWQSIQQVGVGGGGITGWCSLVPQSGLTNCWSFDSAHTTTSTATDAIGSKNATLTNVTLNGSGPSANLNNAGVFNGTSSTGTTTLANVPAAAFSINFWLNPTTINGKRPFANDNPGGGTNNGFQLLGTSGTQFGCAVGNGATSATVSGTPMTVSTWAMITCTYDGTTLTIYTNGVAGATATIAGPITNGSVNLAFGFNPSYSGDFYPGMMAGVSVYNRALTSGEVTTINGL